MSDKPSDVSASDSPLPPTISTTNSTEQAVPPTENATETQPKSAFAPTDTQTAPIVIADVPSSAPDLDENQPTPDNLPDVENPYLLDNPSDRARVEAQARMFKNYLSLNAKRFVGPHIKRILDVGCGEGQLTHVLAQVYPDAEIVGMDISPEAIEVAKRNTKLIRNLSFEVGDVQKVLPAGTFDLVYGSMVWLHVRDRAKALALVYEKLNPGGQFWCKDGDYTGVMSSINHPSAKRLLELVLQLTDKTGTSYHVTPIMEPLLAQQGFVHIRIQKESYQFGRISAEGRIALTVTARGFLNARGYFNKLFGVPEDEIVQIYKDFVNYMMTQTTPSARIYYDNLLAEKPL